MINEIHTKDSKEKLLSALENDSLVDFNAFMFGLEGDVERSILKFICSSGGIVTVAQLKNNIVYDRMICTIERLRRIIDGLVKHDYLYKVDNVFEYKSYKTTTTYYIIKEESNE